MMIFNHITTVDGEKMKEQMADQMKPNWHFDGFVWHDVKRNGSFCSRCERKLSIGERYAPTTNVGHSCKYTLKQKAILHELKYCRECFNNLVYTKSGRVIIQEMLKNKCTIESGKK